MRVLITGAAGVVGTALSQRLSTEHVLVRLDYRPLPADDIAAVQADLCDWRQIRAALAPHAPLDAVVHLAYAATDPELAWEDQAIQQFEMTVRGTWVTLVEAHRLGARRFLYASSLNVYGDLQHGPYPEHFDVLRAPQRDPADPYGTCKYLAEQLMARFCATRGCSGLAFRLDAVHAPGVMERRGVHVDDIAEAFTRALVVSLDGFDVVNLVADPTRHGAPNEKIQELLGWTPRHVFTHRPDLEDWLQLRLR